MKRLHQAIGILLLLEAIVFGHLLWQLSSDPAGYSVQAVGGRTTELHIQPTTPWGGTYGSLNTDGTTSLTISEGDIQHVDIHYADPDNNCSKTELIASIDGATAQELAPIDPVVADGILGYDSRIPYSAAQMFTTQETFDINGQAMTLWTTTTRGALGDYIQGIAATDTGVAFVVKTKRNAQSYNRQAANYQLLLPAGTWQTTYDESDSCTVLDEYETQNVTREDAKLDAAIPERICVNQKNTLYAVWLRSRTYCAPEEVGKWYCQPISGASATLGTTETVSETSTENGSIPFTPATAGTHQLRLEAEGKISYKTLRAETCSPLGYASFDGNEITYPGITIEAAPESTGEPRTESPADIAQSVHADYLLISLLTCVILALSFAGYYRQHKDDSPSLLKLRIWMLERK